MNAHLYQQISQLRLDFSTFAHQEWISIFFQKPDGSINPWAVGPRVDTGESLVTGVGNDTILQMSAINRIVVRASQIVSKAVRRPEFDPSSALFNLVCENDEARIAHLSREELNGPHYIAKYTCDCFPQVAVLCLESLLSRSIPPRSLAEILSEPPTPLQQAIWRALDGRALKKEALAAEICGGDARRLYKTGGIKELMENGCVLNKRKVGYYRPDAMPGTN